MQKTYSVREEIGKTDREKLNVFSDLTSHLLFHRGLKTEDEATAFISPRYEQHEKGLHDPFLLSDMERAVTRIILAMKNDERIAIFSDYDADGIPGAVVLHDFFKYAGYKNFTNYIPHRNDEGFGLNKGALETLAKDGVKLLITVDCGIGNIEEVACANSLGMEVIITDHHIPKEEMPEAYATINPKISPDYPEKMLCGAGVAYKLVQAILEKDRFGIPKDAEKWLLDMVGIATLSDMVPLTGENRIFSFYGLLVLRKSKRLGIQKLLRKLKIDQKKVTEDDVGFMISPRINAASRMGVSYDAFRLLVTEDENEANALIDHLEKINNERKGLTAYISKEVNKMIEAKYSPYFSNKVIVAGSPAWKPSILGLVAGALSENHGKPVFLWGREGVQEALKGSCRSPGVVSLSALMSGVPEGVFNEYGGHAMAGGFSVSYETVHSLEDELERAYQKAILTSKESVVWIDKEVLLENTTHHILKDIEKLSPFGVDNPKPLFLIKNCVIQDILYFGKEKKHLKLLFTNSRLEAILFFVSEEFLRKVEKNKNVSIVGHLERAFFGASSLRIRIVDILS